MAPEPPHPAFEALYPDRGPADPSVTYAVGSLTAGAHHLRLNMVSSVDGGTAFDGRSGGLGGPADRAVFNTIRSFADVIVVGSATMKGEHYGPARPDDTDRAARVARGQAPVPTIAVLTSTAQLDWDTPFFAEAEARPLVMTVDDAPSPPAGAAERVVAGPAGGRVDARRVVSELTARGYPRILVEGGPTINGEFVAAGLLDELCLTISPVLVGGDSRRIVARAELRDLIQLELASLLTSSGFLFARYRRRSD